ncbi:MAG: cation-transporting P-type ATPase [Candidatus Pacebacteria bacterium]|nr:cation-transporting P-type ATPase [Candidatus Paceibacterota bacterium]
MEVFSYSARRVEDILQELKVDEQKGLPVKEAGARLEKYGSNALADKKLKWQEVFFRQFKSAFIYLLIGAAILALCLGEKTDSFMIAVFLAINVTLGFFQEYRSEKTIELLKAFVVSNVKTLRGGKISLVKSEELVVGDIIFLETGDKIPADVRFLKTENFKADESVITGESVSAHKISGVLQKIADNFFEAENIGFSGTAVVDGTAKAVVIKTGKRTVMGSIARLASATKSVSNFEKGINDFSAFILKLIAVTLVLVFASNAILRAGTFEISELLLFSIALTVGVIPEALPLVTTFALSHSARVLARSKVIVKRLSAVEDLGGVEIICTDKTGTLTENSLTVAETWGEDVNTLFLYANLASSDIKKKKTEPFDLALWKKISAAQKNELGKYNRIYEESFNPKKKKNEVMVEREGKRELIYRGAPERILEYCNSISKKQHMEIMYWIKQEGLSGRRVLALARKEIAPDVDDMETEARAQVEGFELLGIVSFVDPIKKSTFAAIKNAQKLGVRIKILTGDSAEVAGAVAYEIGLSQSPEEVITAAALDEMDRKTRAVALDKYSVIARVTPEQKYKIIKELQERYQVGFLGEGINDAPALKVAGVSIVVNGASDIARESADIILLDKSLGVIIEGIREGRTVFANTTKYIKSTLASNFGNFFAVASASLLIDFLPMLPLQILLINLLSDFPMIAVSSDTVDDSELRTPRKYEVKDIVLIASLLGVVSSVFDFLFFGLYYQISPEILRTNWFIGSILTELAFIFSIRTRKPFWRAVCPSFQLISLATLAAAVTLVIPFTRFGQEVFGFVAISASSIALDMAIVVVYFVVSETIKLLYYKSIGGEKGSGRKV